MGKKKSFLEKEILKIALFDMKPCCLEDRQGKYLLYCDLEFHKGFVGKDVAKECVRRKCGHYTIYREDKSGEVIE
jgi:hypothetical protein